MTRQRAVALFSIASYEIIRHMVNIGNLTFSLNVIKVWAMSCMYEYTSIPQQKSPHVF